MGWCGYSLYAGDGTQSLHFNFIEWSGVKINHDEIGDECLCLNKTKIPAHHLDTFIKGIPKILRKMPKRKVYWDEDAAFDWQMLASLLVDNDIYHKEILQQGIRATEYLMGDHAADFDSPRSRRRVLRNFIKRCEKLLRTKKKS